MPKPMLVHDYVHTNIGKLLHCIDGGEQGKCVRLSCVPGESLAVLSLGCLLRVAHLVLRIELN